MPIVFTITHKFVNIISDDALNLCNCTTRTFTLQCLIFFGLVQYDVLRYISVPSPEYGYYSGALILIPSHLANTLL